MLVGVTLGCHPCGGWTMEGFSFAHLLSALQKGPLSEDRVAVCRLV